MYREYGSRKITEAGQQGLAPDALAPAGQAANDVAARSVFGDHRGRKARNTIRRQDAGLALFADFLASAVVTVGDLATDSQAWQGVTWGLVSAFVRWQLTRGYAVSSANVSLSTVKSYAKLALKAGTLDASAYALVRAVEGYNRTEAKRIDEGREAAGLPTRNGHKKAEPVSLTPRQADRLKAQPNTPQGRRDALVMALLPDHGLRVGEVTRLLVTDLDLQGGGLRFYRQKVDKTQTHRLTADTLRAALACLHHDAPAMGPLLRSSRKDGRLHGAGMTTTALTDRVSVLGQAIGVDGLSAHNCRHYWATQAARSGTPIDRLQDAGGWASPAMPLRYVDAARLHPTQRKLPKRSRPP
jgi:integrase